MKRIKDLLKTQKQSNIYEKLNFLKKDDKKQLSLEPGEYDSEDEEFNIGLIVLILLVILILSLGYYLLILQPQMQELQEHKNIKTDQLNSIFNTSLDENGNKQAIQAQIDSAQTTQEVDNIDVYAQALPIIKNQLINDMADQKDKYGRVQILTDDTSNIYDTDEAKKYINSLNVEQLSRTSIQKVDTQIIPLSLNRKQAASGLITVGDTVDIYKKNSNTIQEEEISDDLESNQSSSEISDDTNDTQTHEDISVIENQTSNKLVGGATVVSILRSKDSGAVDSNTELNQYPHTRNYSQTIKTDIQQVLQSKASGTLDESQLKVIYEEYGYKLSNYERIANIGELDAEYIIMLEVPSDSVNELIDDMENIILTIPSYDAPSWVDLK